MMGKGPEEGDFGCLISDFELGALLCPGPRGLGRSYEGFKKKSFKGAQLFGF